MVGKLIEDSETDGWLISYRVKREILEDGSEIVHSYDKSMPVKFPEGVFPESFESLDEVHFDINFGGFEGYYQRYALLRPPAPKSQPKVMFNTDLMGEMRSWSKDDQLSAIVFLRSLI